MILEIWTASSARPWRANVLVGVIVPEAGGSGLCSGAITIAQKMTRLTGAQKSSGGIDWRASNRYK